jgi:glycosyltransferase involved in cell wall biosynthesis
MKISVVLPVYNGARTLRDAIASVRAQSIQSEIIVVNDGSTDESESIARELADVVVSQPNAGVASARNAGLAQVTHSDVVGFIDADEVWLPGKLELQTTLLSDAGIVLGHTQHQWLDDLNHEIKNEVWLTHPRPHLLWCLGASLVRREVFDAIGSFDVSLRASEDVDFFLRARDAGITMTIHDDVVQYARRHGENMTYGRSLEDLQFLEVIKRSLDRRRKATT